jgi:CRISPR/Cas system-associated endoribonuclease Cas2
VHGEARRHAAACCDNDQARRVQPSVFNAGVQ